MYPSFYIIKLIIDLIFVNIFLFIKSNRCLTTSLLSLTWLLKDALLTSY